MSTGRDRAGASILSHSCRRSDPKPFPAGAGLPCPTRRFPSTPRDSRATVAGSLVAKTLEVATLVLSGDARPASLGPADFGRFSVLLTDRDPRIAGVDPGRPDAHGPLRSHGSAPRARCASPAPIGGRLTRGRAAQLVAIGLAAFVATVASPEHVPPSRNARSCSAPSR